jgi:hypothetical protein
MFGAAWPSKAYVTGMAACRDFLKAYAHLKSPAKSRYAIVLQCCTAVHHAGLRFYYSE